MIQKGKWLDGVDRDQPVSAAAQRALRARLDLVWYYTPLAALHHRRDVEYVHQLRVSTRRAMAAIDAYGKLTPAKQADRLRRQLRRLRRAAGEARDLDVLLERLRNRPDRRPTIGWEVLLQRVERLRWQAQAPLVKRYRKLRRKKFKQQCRRLARRSRWRDSDVPEPTFEAAARQALRDIAEPFFTAAAGDLSQIEALHELRIHGKHLRYAMELFAAALPAEFRGELYRQIEAIQERLGQLNDHASALARFERWRDDWQDPLLTAPLEQLIASEQAELLASQAVFLNWWMADRAGQLRQRFHQLLDGGDVRLAGG